MNDNHSTPLFSIVTVCYNSEKTIERTIKSVLAQGFLDYEYLIIDGGSTDNTINIITKYEPLFSGRLRWISEQDNGIYDAFNKGCQMASGEYIWLVNSDDWIEPNALLELKRIAIDNLGKTCILVARMYMHYVNGKISETPLIVSRNIDRCGKDFLMGITHPASVYSKHVYEIIGYYDDRYYISGDIDHFIRCYQSKSVEFIPINTFITNMSDGGISNSFNFEKVNHDWVIRYSKFCTSRFDFIKRIIRSNYNYLKGYLISIIKK